MEQVIGVDLYNQCLTGEVAKTMNSRATDSDHIPCVVKIIGADIYNLMLTGNKACSLTSGGWTSTGTCPKVLILDHHPNDSRTDIAEDQQAIQTLTSRMGTGGGNVPMVLEYHSQALRIKPLEDNVSPTIPAGFGEGGANTTTPVLILEPIPLEGNGARPSHRGDGFRKEGPMYSLNTTEVHSIAYAFEPGILKREGKENRICKEVTPTIREHMGDNQTAVAYTLKIRSGCDTYTKWDGKQGTAGKGALIQIEKSATLAASQDQYLFQPIDNANREQNDSIACDTEEPITFDVFHLTSMENGAQILKARDYKDPQIVCCAISTYGSK